MRFFFNADKYLGEWSALLDQLAQAAAIDGTFDQSAAKDTVRLLSRHFSDDESIVDRILIAACAFAMPEPESARQILYAGAVAAKPGSIADQRLTEDWFLRSRQSLDELDLQKAFWIAACEGQEKSVLKKQGLENYDISSHFFVELIKFVNSLNATDKKFLESKGDARKLAVKLADEFAEQASYARRQGPIAQEAEKRAAKLFEATLRTLDAKSASEKANAVVQSYHGAMIGDDLRVMNEGILARSELQNFSFELLRAAQNILKP